MNPVPQSTLDQLVQKSSAMLDAFDALPIRSPHDAEAVAFVRDVEALLRECIATGRFLPPGSPDRRMLAAIVNEWNSRLRREGHRPAGLDRLEPFDPKAGNVLDAACPYPGLSAYGAKESGRFFGRDALAEQYAERLLANRIFLIVGASGSGKSSLALAGIRPRLMDAHPDWLFPDPFTPGGRPIEALAKAVGIAAGRDEAAADAFAQSVAEAPASAAENIEALCDDRPLVLLIDQFEELFTLCPDSQNQRTFAELLLLLSDKQRSDWECHVLLTLRTDHLARFDNSDLLKPLYRRLVDEGNFEHLPALNFVDIRRAIVEPANAVGLRFIPADIPDRLASETAGLANGLPLLQFALRRLWDTRPRNDEGQPLDIINEAMIARLPDVQRALGTVADGIFETLTETQQAICERTMLELVVLDESFEVPLRRRRKRDELSAVLTARFAGAESDIETLETCFVEAGLLRIFGSGEAAQIEITHEALLRHWDRLNQVVNGEEVKKRLHAIKQIAREAMEWKTHGKSEDRLKQQGEPLAEALGYLEENWCADAESADYLRACEQREKAAHEQARQLEHEKREAQRAREAAIVAARESAEARTRQAEAIAEEAKARAEQAEAQTRAERDRKKILVGFGISILIVIGLGKFLTSSIQSRNASLVATASLSERLPPLEALDLTYTLAKKRGSNFRFALAVALERMEDTIVLGERNSSVYPTSDGTALLQFDQSTKALRIYLVGDDGRPKVQPVEIVPGKGFEQLAQVQVSPKIKDGAHADRHLVVLAYALSAKPGFRLETYVIDGSALTERKVAVLDKFDTPLDGYYQLSAIRLHSDGQRAIFSAFDETNTVSLLLELSLDAADTVNLTQISDPMGVVDCADNDSTCRANSTITAVAYGYGDQSPASRNLVTGRLNGTVYCGPDLETDRANPAANANAPPIRALVAHPKLWPYASADKADAVRSGICPRGDGPPPHLFPQPGKPNSLKFSLVERKSANTHIALLTYFDQDQQLRCYINERQGKDDWRWYLCNAAHPLSDAAITTSQWQVAVVQNGLSAVRRYPAEGRFDSQDARTQALSAVGLTLRWTTQRGGNGKKANLDRSDDDPWSVGDGTITASKERVVTSAAISADGKKLAWIEERNTNSHQALLSKSSNTGQLRTVNLIRTMDVGKNPVDVWRKSQLGRALAIAIDDTGRVAHVQGPTKPGGQSTLHLDDDKSPKIQPIPRDDREPECLAFSPNGEYLLLGMGGGGLYRVATSAPEIVFDQKQPPDRVSTQVSACTVADDGTVVAGYKDGNVWEFPSEGEPRALTARTVDRFPRPIRQVTIAGKRVAALGEWQINNCTSPGLPGQTLRIWDLSSTETQQPTPIGNTCFPNEVVSSLGAWGQKGIKNHSEDCPKPNDASGAGARVGVCLIGPEASRWHECPACERKGETPERVLERLLKAAAGDDEGNKGKGAKLLSSEELLSRYGIKLD